jgi:nucleoside-diphosphate-sugar epimerase
MKKILLTGSSGFLGKNILLELQKNYSVSTLDLENATYTCNLSKEAPALNERFDIVLHAAGKAHSIPKSEAEKQLFFDVNYQGTVNLCKALEKTKIPQSFVFISTVAVYGCEQGIHITEDYPKQGITPYALSKIQAEDFLIEWCEKHRVILSILRPSLIAGPNPPGNLHDMIQGIKTGRYLSIAGGKACKSLLMVQDVARLIPLLEEKGGIYNVCSDDQPTFRDLEKLIAQQLNKKPPVNIPLGIARFFAFIGNFLGKKAPINSAKLEKITQSRILSNQKAKETLGWKPLNVLEHFTIE